jgi:hypothetical protein
LNFVPQTSHGSTWRTNENNLVFARSKKLG